MGFCFVYSPPMRWLPLLFALGLCVHAADYSFLLNGQPAKASHLPVFGTTGHYEPGDVVTLGEFSFILDEPGEYDFLHTETDQNRLWRKRSDGRKELVALNFGEYSAPQTPQSEDALSGLTPAERKSLRGLVLRDWTPKVARALDQLEWIHTALFLRITTADPNLPKLPANIRYLSVGEEGGKLSNIETLRNLTQLVFLDLDTRNVSGFDYHILRAGPSLRRLVFSSGDDPAQHPEALKELTGLHHLDLNWRTTTPQEIEAIATIQNLRTLSLRVTTTIDLRPLGKLTRLERIEAEGSPIEKLPVEAMPALRELNVLGSRVNEVEAKAFRTRNPHCMLQYDYLEVLQQALVGTTRVRLRTGGTCHRDTAKEKTLYETTTQAEADEFIARIAVESAEGVGGCMCCGSPTLEFYAGDRLAVTLGMQHGFALRWTERWPSDAQITEVSADYLANWMARHGAKEPRESLRQHRASQRAAADRQARYDAIMPGPLRDALAQAQSEGEAITAFEQHLPDETDRALLELALFGCDPGSWDLINGLDQPLASSLLPRIGGVAFAAAARKADPAGANGCGLARWLFAEEKWKELEPGALTAVLDPIGRMALGHPRQINRRKTMLALEAMGTPGARGLLLAAMHQEIAIRPLPKTLEDEPGGMRVFKGQGIEIPGDLADHLYAALALTKLQDESSAAEIGRLLESQPKEIQELFRKVRAGEK